MLYTVLVAALVAVNSQDLGDLAGDLDLGDVADAIDELDNIADELLPTSVEDDIGDIIDEGNDFLPTDVVNDVNDEFPFDLDLTDIAIPDWSEEIWAIIELVDPEMLLCDVENDTVLDEGLCDQVDWLACNANTSICGVPCDTADDCVIEDVEGTGFSVCSDAGWCQPNWDGDCTEDNDCPSIIGYTCWDGTCRQPMHCEEDSDCDDMPDGLKKCHMLGDYLEDAFGDDDSDSDYWWMTTSDMNDTYTTMFPTTTEGIVLNVCGIETCDTNGTAECVSDGYVCQNDFICVPSCEDIPCEDVGLTCGDDGLCYMAEECETDDDCDSPFNTCFKNITGFGDFVDDNDIPVSTSVCATTCTTADDCDEDYFPWAVCQNLTDNGTVSFAGAAFSGLCASDPNFDWIANQTDDLVTYCGDDDDCEDDWMCMDLNTTLDIDTDDMFDLPEGICVPNTNGTDIYNFTDLISMCTSDDDCSDDAPVCVNATSDLTDSGTCLPLCRDDDDCEAMGFENGFCQATTAGEGEVYNGYSTCITLDPCDAFGSTGDCNSDQVCVDDRCFGQCDTDDDCDDGVTCEEVSYEIPFIGEEISFGFCNVLDMDTTSSPTQDTESGGEEGTESGDDDEPTTTEQLGEGGDGASHLALFSAAAIVVSALLF